MVPPVASVQELLDKFPPLVSDVKVTGPVGAAGLGAVSVTVAVQDVAWPVAAVLGWKVPDQSWPNAEVQQTHFTEVQQLLAGKITVDAALQAMDKAYKGCSARTSSRSRLGTPRGR